MIVEHIYPPIPNRRFDYVAYCCPECGARGYGKTPTEALRSLVDEMSPEEWDSLTAPEQREILERLEN